jgi:cytoskeletal protein CcmA (bactofilin family)
MKKFVMLMTMFLFLLPATGLAADIRNTETVSKDVAVKNLYLAGQNPTIDASVTGDLVTAGNTVTVNGDVSGDVMAAGSVLNLNGNVGNSLHVAGGTVNLNSGTVGGDVIIFGGNVVLGSKSTVTGDVIIFGGTFDSEGKILGSIKNSYVGSANLNGSVAGDVNFLRVGTLTIGSNNVITGSLNYTSQTEGNISSSSKVGGKVDFTKVAADNTVSSLVPILGSVILGLLMVLVTILLFIYLMPKFTKSVVNNVLVNPWAKLGIGFLALVVTPILMLVLAITLFGLGIVGYLALVYILIIALAGTLSAVFAGSYAWKLIRKGKDLVVNWKTAVIGIVIVTVVKIIPIIGWLAVFVLFLLVFGTLVTMSFEFMKAQRA